MGELGLLGMLVPEEYGGAGMDTVAYCVAIEEIARVCPAMAVTMSVTNSVCCWPIVRLRQRGAEAHGCCRELASGEALGGFGLTEPGAGSDAGSHAHHGPPRRRLLGARRREGLDHQRRLRAATSWCVAQDRPGRRASAGISAFVVPADAPGLLRVGAAGGEAGPQRVAHRARSSSTAAAFRPATCSAQEGQGFKIALATLDHSRLGIAAQSVGIHQRALELAVAYANERVQFGVPIAEHQAIQFKLAQMATELAAARALTCAAAAARAAPRRPAGWPPQAKLYASEAANRAC